VAAARCPGRAKLELVGSNSPSEGRRCVGFDPTHPEGRQQERLRDPEPKWLEPKWLEPKWAVVLPLGGSRGRPSRCQ